MFKGKVRRFIVIPICTVEDKDGNPIREEKGKPFPVLIGNLPDLKKVAEQLEVRYERDYFSRVNSKAANIKRSTRNTRHRGKVKTSSTRQV